MQTAELDARDERVSKKIMAHLESLRDETREANERARTAERLARAAEQAVSDGAWWKLSGILDAADVESLCSVEPATPTERRQTYLGWDC